MTPIQLKPEGCRAVGPGSGQEVTAASDKVAGTSQWSQHSSSLVVTSPAKSRSRLEVFHWLPYPPAGAGMMMGAGLVNTAVRGGLRDPGGNAGGDGSSVVPTGMGGPFSLLSLAKKVGPRLPELPISQEKLEDLYMSFPIFKWGNYNAHCWLPPNSHAPICSLLTEHSLCSVAPTTCFREGGPSSQPVMGTTGFLSMAKRVASTSSLRSE